MFGKIEREQGREAGVGRDSVSLAGGSAVLSVELGCSGEERGCQESVEEMVITIRRTPSCNAYKWTS